MGVAARAAEPGNTSAASSRKGAKRDWAVILVVPRKQSGEEPGILAGNGLVSVGGQSRVADAQRVEAAHQGIELAHAGHRAHAYAVEHRLAVRP